MGDGYSGDDYSVAGAGGAPGYGQPAPPRPVQQQQQVRAHEAIGALLDHLA